MIKLLVGEAGSGKSKIMIQMANDSLDEKKGEVVYIEASAKHMHQLHRDIRFISTEDFNLSTVNSLYGFLCGILSENYDIQKIFIDGLDKIVRPMTEHVLEFFSELEKVSEKYEADLVMSSSLPAEYTEALQKYVIQE